MTSIPSISQSQGIGQTQQAAGNPTLGKDDFLNLLVTQLRFQNPLEPMEDTEFVAQLAQFSSLEQLSNISTSLDTSSQLDYVLSQTIANTMATTLIGREVIAAGDQTVHGYNESNRLDFDLSADAANVEVKVFDENGILIRTITSEDMAEGINSMSWDGKDDSGASVTAGNYSFTVMATDEAGNAIAADTRRIGIVESVRYEDGQGYLIVDGQRIALSDIIEVNLGGGSNYRNSDNG